MEKKDLKQKQHMEEYQPLSDTIVEEDLEQEQEQQQQQQQQQFIEEDQILPDIGSPIDFDMDQTLPIAVAKGIVSKVLSLAFEVVVLASGFKGDLLRLAKKLETVRALLFDAESKKLPLGMMESCWLQKVKVVARDAEVVFDDFKYEVLRQEIEVKGGVKSKVCNFFSPSKSPVAFRLKMAIKIRNVNLLLDDIKKRATKIGLRAVEVNSTTTFDDSVIVGRADDVSIVVDRLLDSNVEERLPVISIVGTPGQGKTALARSVYNDKRVVSHFDKRIWVDMSDDFGVIGLLNKVVKSLTKTNSRVLDMEAISKKLEAKLGGKMYLLVLDDVSHQNLDKWDFVRNSLIAIGGSRGSHVMVTTRSEVVVSTMQTSLTRQLVGLSEKDGWDLFKRRAFAEGGALETDSLEEIGREIVQRCGGLPLAINLLGDLMHSKKSEKEWQLIQYSHTWDSKESIVDVVHTLKLIYGHLEASYWKLCFAYCSIFPEDYVIYIDRLILSWMALGFLNPPKDSGLLMEDIGNCFVDFMLSNSLLQEAYDCGGRRFRFKKMCEHDEVARHASNSYCFTSEVEVDNASEVVHLSLSSDRGQALKIVNRQFRRLQTLFLNGGPVSITLTNFKCLRVLILESYDTAELPSSIGKLKQLRYLDIKDTEICTLPNSITKLYNLQIIKASERVEWLPKNFGNLINLRHLLLDSRTNSLETTFNVKQDRRWHLEELGRLNNLTGALRICRLEEVESLIEAKNAYLSRKANIHTLTLDWCHREKNERVSTKGHNDQDVLKGLKPHSNLKDLAIENFEGTNFPLWMTEERQSRMVLNNLVSIRLEKCRGCSHIPALGHLPCLKVVEIVRMSNVRTMGSEFYGRHTTSGGEGASSSTGAVEFVIFPSLRELTLRNMRRLKEWSEAVHPSRYVFPSLEVLNIEFCKRLRMVPTHFPSLKELHAEETNSAALKEMSGKLTSLTSLSLRFVEGSELQYVVEGLLGNNRSLRELSIYGSNLNSLANELVGLERLSLDFCNNLIDIPRLPSVREVSIIECEKLIGLPNNLEALERLSLEGCNNLIDIPCLPFVKEVSISACNKLIGLPSLTEVFPVIENLTIKFCCNMMAFPDMHCHTSLRKLHIMYCEKLTSIPKLCMSLWSLEIDSCEKLTSLPELGTALEELYVRHCPAMVNLPDCQYLRKLVLYENSKQPDYVY